MSWGMTRIDPPLPVLAEEQRGEEFVKATAYAWIDYGLDHDLIWLIAYDESREFWCLANKFIRCQDNITAGRPPAGGEPFCGVGVSRFEAPPELAKRKGERAELWERFLARETPQSVDEAYRERMRQLLDAEIEDKKRLARLVAEGKGPNLRKELQASFENLGMMGEPPPTHLWPTCRKCGEFCSTPYVHRCPPRPSAESARGGPETIKEVVFSPTDQDKEKLKKMLAEGIGKHGLAEDAIAAQVEAAEMIDEWEPRRAGPGNNYISGYRCRKCNGIWTWPQEHFCPGK